jgi:hypothetical protein
MYEYVCVTEHIYQQGSNPQNNYLAYKGEGLDTVFCYLIMGYIY